MTRQQMFHALIEIGATVDDKKAEILLMAVKEIGLWDKLYLYLNDYALGVAPSELDDEKTYKHREIEYGIITDIIHVMDEMERKVSICDND